MNKINDQNYVGKQFGHFIVKESISANGGLRFKIQCCCGKEKCLPAYIVLTGHTKSCGCRMHKGVKRGRRREILTGQKFGRLTVLENSIRPKFRQPQWKCQCDCGNKLMVHAYRLKSGKTQSCGCIKKEQTQQKHHSWTGYGEISGSFWCGIKKGATNRKLEFNISIQEAWNLFLQQNRKCALSGTSLTFPISKKLTSLSTASLDRIDSSKGYLSNNIQWVSKDLNVMKMNKSDKKFIEYCKIVTDFQNKKSQKINLGIHDYQI